MATDTAYPARDFSLGNVFSQAFSTIVSNPVVTIGVAFLFGALPQLLYSLATRSIQMAAIRPGQPPSGLFVGMSLLGIVVMILVAQLTQGALVRATAAHDQGRVAGFAESVICGLRALLPLFLLGMIIGVGVMIGMFLLLVPAIILYVMWSVAAPALVEEKSGVIQALGRSRALTKGKRWQIFGLHCLVLIGMSVFSAVLGAIMMAVFGLGGFVELAKQGPPWWYLLLGSLFQAVVAAFTGTIQAALYFELRGWKDGPATGSLSDIFA